MLDFHKQLVILSFLNFSDDETKPLRYRVLFPIDTVIADFKAHLWVIKQWHHQYKETLKSLNKDLFTSRRKIKEYNDKL
jgi:hypothetical protein